MARPSSQVPFVPWPQSKFHKSYLAKPQEGRAKDSGGIPEDCSHDGDLAPGDAEDGLVHVGRDAIIPKGNIRYAAAEDDGFKVEPVDAVRKDLPHDPERLLKKGYGPWFSLGETEIDLLGGERLL